MPHESTVGFNFFSDARRIFQPNLNWAAIQPTYGRHVGCGDATYVVLYHHKGTQLKGTTSWCMISGLSRLTRLHEIWLCPMCVCVLLSFLDDLFVAHRLSGVAVNIFTVTGRNMINTSPAICVINTGAKRESKKIFLKFWFTTATNTHSC